jgi:glycerol kinase
MALTAQLAADTPSLARTVAWSAAGDTRFALEGNIAMAGAAIQWLGEFLGLTQPAAGVAALAETVTDSNGVYFVPAMVGLGAPHWDAEARGAISGLSRSHTAAHLARAALQAVAFQIADVFFEMECASGMRFQELRADGGATRNASLMQFQADILGRPVLRSVNEELSAIGAAWLAGIKLGWWENMSGLEAMKPATERFDPKVDGCERTRRYRGWQKAVESVRANKEATA